MTRFTCVASLALLAASTTTAVASAEPAREWTPFPVSESPRFFRPRQTLERLAASEHERSASFCVVGYRGPDDAVHAWVVWPSRRTLILWEPSSDGIDNLMRSRRWLHLDRDVVANDVAVGGSTYLVTRAWADSVISDCRERGERWSVRPPAAQSRRK